MQPVPWLAPTLPCRAPRARVVLVRRHALPREGKRQRLVVVMSLVLSYSWFYVCRLSLTYAGPAVVKQEGLDLRTLGAILSSGQISIGLSKIMSSVLTANWSPSRCLVLGMLLTAACNLLAAGAPAHGARLTLLLALVWAVNGLFQGTGKQRGLRQRHCLSGLDECQGTWLLLVATWHPKAEPSSALRCVAAFQVVEHLQQLGGCPCASYGGTGCLCRLAG